MRLAGSRANMFAGRVLARPTQLIIRAETRLRLLNKKSIGLAKVWGLGVQWVKF